MKRLLRLIFFLVIVIIILVGIQVYQDDIKDFFEETSSDLAGFLDQGDELVFVDEPLRGPVEESLGSILTVDGIVVETNRHRIEAGLPPLTINSQLNDAAMMKVDDMFARQYFAHDSPTGEGPGDLAKAANYEYLMVGENLALGNFLNDEELVQAWMDSPGHRENILKPAFSEIGVGVRRGYYEGQSVWMAVQEFGRPASECPIPSEVLEENIHNNNVLLESMSEDIKDKNEEIRRYRPKIGPEYNRMVVEYNEMVEEYNELLKITRDMIENFNRQAEEYNICVSGA